MDAAETYIILREDLCSPSQQTTGKGTAVHMPRIQCAEDSSKEYGHVEAHNKNGLKSFRISI